MTGTTSHGPSKRSARCARPRRQAPIIDTTSYANWNAMYIGAYFDAYRFLGREDCKTFALKTLDLLWSALWDPGRGMHHQSANGERRITGLLDDHVQMAVAMLDAHE